ncbi:GAF domain-containing protein [Cellulosimicrobium sp. CUA-896]|uniref:GAF domain-containing protein n=1 Tax=Cellulosimicrobium sp. CUA-896 TaxID=1517881 RepID=UPI000959EC5B|nr:GAF domain-containing protein [Cellulosimicrobium sp. CUA-896]OLT54538.1 hypothetical protein BJF88_08370 [Cellulosimicrobium sp. CUA-896]
MAGTGTADLEDVMALATYLNDHATGAAGALGEGVEVSIIVRDHGVTLLAGSSSPAAGRCDQVEARAEDGPCIEAMTHRKVQVVSSVPRERRWREWRDATVREGFHRTVAVPAKVGPGTMVALDVYSRADAEWNPGLLRTARAMADLVATDVRLHLRFADVEDAAAGMYRRMSDDTAVERAVGTIMEANACTPEAARQTITELRGAGA